MRQNRCGTGETRPHLILDHAEAMASEITSVI